MSEQPSEQDRRDVAKWLAKEADHRTKFFPQRVDGIDALLRQLAREVLPDEEMIPIEYAPHCPTCGALPGHQRATLPCDLTIVCKAVTHEPKCRLLAYSGGATELCGKQATPGTNWFCEEPAGHDVADDGWHKSGGHRWKENPNR